MVRGQRFGPRLIKALVRELDAHAGDIDNTELADRLKVHRTTVGRYRARAEAAQQARQADGPSANDLQDVDMAMVMQAKKGNVAAARLVFARMGHRLAPDVSLPSIAELEEALALLKQAAGERSDGSGTMTGES